MGGPRLLFLLRFNPGRPPSCPDSLAMAECWQKECGDVGAKVQEKDRRHTLNLQVPIPQPSATGPATGGFRAGNTVHLERAQLGPDRSAGPEMAVGPKVQSKGRQAAGGTLREPPAGSAQPRRCPGAQHFSRPKVAFLPHSRATARPCPSGRTALGQVRGLPVPSPCAHCHPQLCSGLSAGCTTV